MADDLVERLEELIIADAFEARHITSSMLAERLIKERAEAAARITALEAEVERLKGARRPFNDALAERVIDGQVKDMDDLRKLAQSERSQRQSLEAAIAAKDAEIERLKEAMTPSAETKAALMGEFTVPLPEIDEDGEEYIRRINVPWTTVKEIMTAIRARAALQEDTTQ